MNKYIVWTFAILLLLFSCSESTKPEETSVNLNIYENSARLDSSSVSSIVKKWKLIDAFIKQDLSSMSKAEKAAYEKAFNTFKEHMRRSLTLSFSGDSTYILTAPDAETPEETNTEYGNWHFTKTNALILQAEGEKQDTILAQFEGEHLIITFSEKEAKTTLAFAPY